MLPFQFVIAGPPFSAQSDNREALADWQLRVQAVAATEWAGPVFRGKVHVVVTYYHEGETARLDNDNMIKPILDALEGVVYDNDRQASYIEVRSLNLKRAARLRRVGAVVGWELVRGGEFLHILVEEER